MLRSFKKLVSLVLVLALSLTVSLPAFAEKSNTDYRNAADIVEARYTRWK